MKRDHEPRTARRAPRDLSRPGRHDGPETPFTGQTFHDESVSCGIILTKLDGTAKGGVCDSHRPGV